MAEETTQVEDETLREIDMRGAVGVVQTQKLDGREYSVVPVVALVEGVIHASNAQVPEYVPIDTIRRAATSFNGRPIVINHPVKNGKSLSANSPEFFENQTIGLIFNARVESNRLLCDAWIDVDKARRLDQNLFARLMAGKTEEVSVGVHVTANRMSGNFGGKKYEATWLEATADHLAFLPESRGACSVEMGCGTNRIATMHLVTAEGIEVETLGDVPGHEFHGNQYGIPAGGHKGETTKRVKGEETHYRGIGGHWSVRVSHSPFSVDKPKPTVFKYTHYKGLGIHNAMPVSAHKTIEEAHKAAHERASTRFTGLEEASELLSLEAEELAPFLRSLMPRGWGDDEVKQDLRDALHEIEPASQNGDILRITANTIIYCLYPPIDPPGTAYSYPFPMPKLTYWQRSYSFNTDTQKFEIDSNKQEVEPTTVYVPCAAAEEEKTETLPSRIVPEGGRFVLYSRDKTRKLGVHTTLGDAQVHERAIDAVLARRSAS